MLAGHVLDEDVAAADPEHARYLAGEINGLCVALRLPGGYEGVAFDAEWARSVAPADFDWRAFFGYAGGRGSFLRGEN